MFDNNVERHYVYVKNRDNNPGYFTVRFYFEDWNGNDRIEKESHHLNPGEEKRFSFQTIYGERYNNFEYEVTSESTDPDGWGGDKYYDDYGRYDSRYRDDGYKGTRVVTRYDTGRRCYN